TLTLANPPSGDVREVKLKGENKRKAKVPVSPDGSKPDKNQAKVQLAILLDTSGSMSGLIEQAKTQLWSIVNTFIRAKQNGKVPFVEVALYEYGNDGLNAENHWIRQIQPLTRDLDKISEELFALRTNGGSEFCGAVIKRAVGDLKWDVSPNTYKAIFVAGNEPFTQGPVDPESACREAIKNGVIVNTIHCGPEQVGISTGWKTGSLLADGKYLVIDHNKAVVHVDAPQDKEILKWNTRLNETYVPIGRAGARRLEVQKEQDNLAEGARGNALQARVQTKASVNYWNGNWDLVDACTSKDFDWKKVQVEDLPEEMRAMSHEERKAYIEGKREERKTCHERIKALTGDRLVYVKAKLREMGEGEEDTLNAVMVETVRQQASVKGYT
ncbi:MAG: vWA domain-containing protein, partial [Verrucomicrobiota bacterium]|nr:vWA domain-containing protein [Verrucomicrobiota bacterium]